ncbi:hypothetical protein KP509_01G115000 [Ceratopteris richardii]|nr:hypothetical protein KP509_01G115000 [Ceratopteris richardii]
MGENEEEEELLLDEFFVDESYVLKSFKYGSNTISLYCLETSSTDYDLTGQIVWPGAELLNRYITQGSICLDGLSILELGSGLGLTGILCGRYCQKIVMTDHMDKVLKVLQRNIDMQSSLSDEHHNRTMMCEKLEWGNEEHINNILQNHPEGFDLIIGADICYQQASLHPLFKTVKSLLSHEACASKQFILSYVSRARSIDIALFKEAENQSLKISEIAGTRTWVHDNILEGTLYQVQLRNDE